MNKQYKSKLIIGIVTLVIILAAFLCLAFIKSFERNSTFWISLCIGLVAIAVSAWGVIRSCKKGQGGLTVTMIAIVFSLVQALAGVIAMVTSSYTPGFIWILAGVILLFIEITGLLYAMQEKGPAEENKETENEC